MEKLQNRELFLYFGPQTTLETHLATVTHPCLIRGGSHNRREMREGPKIYEGCYKMWRDTMEKANHCCLLSKFTQISRQVNPGNTLYLAYIQISGNLRQNTLIENSLQYRCTQHLLQKAAKMLKFVFCFWASRCHRQYRTHFEKRCVCCQATKPLIFVVSIFGKVQTVRVARKKAKSFLYEQGLKPGYLNL